MRSWVNAERMGTQKALRMRGSGLRHRPAGCCRREGAVLPLLLVLLALSAMAYSVSPFRPAVVVGRSMTPSLRSGQVVLIDCVRYRRHAIQRGDVIAFRHEGQVHVKRVIGLSGDLIWEVRSRETPEAVFLADASQLARLRRFVARHHMPDCFCAVRVPAGSVYVLGDGGNLSRDSRHYGPVSEGDVVGRVTLREARVAALRRALELAAM